MGGGLRALYEALYVRTNSQNQRVASKDNILPADVSSDHSVVASVYLELFSLARGSVNFFFFFFY